MNETDVEKWEWFKKNYFEYPPLGLALDLSQMKIPEAFFKEMQEPFARAFSEMLALEAGAIANADEGRMVGHYWLRNPDLAPTPEIRDEIRQTIDRIKRFASVVHGGVIRGEKGIFKNVLLIGIGGSSLGPQFVADALGNPTMDKMRMWFFDNTDPDGMNRILDSIGDGLGQTVCLVVSKSGGTKETRNGMLVAHAAYKSAGLTFSNHAVAITQSGSELDDYAKNNKWLESFPMWDWVGGRTSQTSAVGLLPIALQGVDINEFLSGARLCDEMTRLPKQSENPAALLALSWFFIGGGKGERHMVVLPYKDRLCLFSKYLQQLIMESLGKGTNRAGHPVSQGLTVFGNKGSTDQHSYVQQLREGKKDFFVTFIEVVVDVDGQHVEVEPNLDSSDYLQAFLLGTRSALAGNDRPSTSIIIDQVTPASVGMLIALFERAVGFYASLLNINAYNQPGVEAGKKAATRIIDAKKEVISIFESNKEMHLSVTRIREMLPVNIDYEEVFRICEKLSSNPRHRILKHGLHDLGVRCYNSY